MEVFEIFMVFMVLVLHVLVEFGVLEIDISDTRSILFWLGCCLTGKQGRLVSIFKVSHRETFELHHVLRKRTCLITENVVHHSKLFVQIRGLNSCLESPRFIAHFDVNGDEVSLDKVDHLKSNKK